MRHAVIGFAAGVWLLQRQAALPGVLVLAPIGVAAAVVAALAGIRAVHPSALHSPTPRYLRRGAQVTLFALLGFVWAALCAEVRISDRLDPASEGAEVRIAGVVAGLPQFLERGVRFEFDVESVSPAGTRVPSRIVLSWYDGLTLEEHQEVAPVRAGERWRFGVRLKRPHGQLNPAGFDYEAWLLERGIRATGTVLVNRTAPPPVRLETMVVRPGYGVERLRERVRERFWDALPEHRYAGILTALAIGEQRAIEPEDWDVFTRTGINHLMSISGLHVTMVSSLAAALVMFAWRRSQALVLRLPAQKAAAFAGFAAAFGYCVVSGFAIPAQRTLYMVGVVALALVFDRLTSASRVLALALAVVLILDPWAVLSAGFWLSFGAVALIFYVGSCRIGPRHWLAQWGAMQWAVTVGLAPMLLVLFGQVSLASPLANAVAIPVVSGLITPLALAGAVLPFDFPLELAHVLLEWLMWLLGALAGLDGAVWAQHAPQRWTLPIAVLGIAWLLLPRGFPSRWMGALLLIPLASVGPPLLARGAVSLTVLDVGQGLSVLVRTRSHALLYDAGPAWGSGADSGNRVVVPVLRALGLKALDAMIISHDDNDHAGGALSVMRSVPAALLYSSLASFDPIALSAQYRIPCAESVNWVWDGVRFEFLHPEMARYADPGESANNLSCVLKLSSAFGTAIIAGDLEWRGEAALIERRKSDLAAQVLVVPHHGSSTSSTPAFVRAVSPRVAVVSLGYRNWFGHPRPEVLARYRAQGSRILRTDRSGAVHGVFDPQGVAVRGQRERVPRYWHGQ
ncbi:MAG: DNA internalization-related competence protein ComEC/Rec2 [Betaproteobacteria bacterium RIFCSPLOWO2_12_FULL_63_13]|nr:MAG: DNA internalization-related competence protein ComEC/Rec2 [Betaproteobacteria bacterium RIFCSPLOWO2_12_FULL_63_13]